MKPRWRRLLQKIHILRLSSHDNNDLTRITSQQEHSQIPRINTFMSRTVGSIHDGLCRYMSYSFLFPESVSVLLLYYVSFLRSFQHLSASIKFYVRLETRAKNKARKTWIDVYNKHLLSTYLHVPGTVLGSPDDNK